MAINGGSIYVNDATDDLSTPEPSDGAYIRIDPPGITVVSVTRVGATPTNATSVKYTVTFSGPATNVSTAAFSLGSTGNLTPAISSVSGSGTTYTVTINTGGGDGTIRLDVNGTGISPTVTGTIPFPGLAFVIDNTSPVISSFTINNGAAYTTSTDVTLNITTLDVPSSLQMAFSNDDVTYSNFEAYATSKAWTIPAGDARKTVYIKVKDAAGNVTTRNAAINLDQTAPTGTTITSGPPLITNSRNATFNFTSDDPSATFEASLDGGSYYSMFAPMNFLNLSVAHHTLSIRAKDAAGHVDPVPATYSWEIEQTPPVIDYVAPPLDGTYKDGAILSFVVTFSENITVTGTPTLDVIIGSNTRKANLVGVTNNIATFTYQLLMPDMDDNGIELGPIGLPSGAKITDLAGNNLASLTLNGVPPLDEIKVDTKHPTATISSAATFPVTGSFTINIAFDKEIVDNLTA
jgi:hypothetical protein